MRRPTFGIIKTRRISQAVVGARPGWVESTGPGLKQKWQWKGSKKISILGFNTLSQLAPKTPTLESFPSGI